MADDTFSARLCEIPLFSELSDGDLDILGQCCTETSAPKGAMLFHEGDHYYGFFIVVTGSVKVYKLTPDGRESMLHIIRPINTLAEIPMFLGAGYPAHAEALEDSRLVCVYKEGFLRMLRTHPDLALKMLAGLSRRLKTLGERIEKLTVLDVKTRLARYILDEARAQGRTEAPVSILLPTSKTLLAAQLGTIVETLSRTFRKLEDEGLIRVEGRRIILPDPDELHTRYEEHTS
jgi:CRP/FNR family transcriptional regulator, dissimilatory nitrate respiration regulator